MKKFFFGCLMIAFCIKGYAQNNIVLGDTFVDENWGISMRIPAGWQQVDYNIGLIIVGPTDNEFTPNITFGNDDFDGAVSQYIEAVLEFLSGFYTDLKVLQRRNFSTNSGLQGELVVIQANINNISVRQRFYCIQNRSRTSIMGITGSVGLVHGERYDAIFDECIKTFDWLR